MKNFASGGAKGEHFIHLQSSWHHHQTITIMNSLSIGALVMQQQIRSDIEALQARLLEVSIQPSSQNFHQSEVIANTSH